MEVVLGNIDILHMDYCEPNIANIKDRYILGGGLDWYPVAYGSHSCTFCNN